MDKPYVSTTIEIDVIKPLIIEGQTYAPGTSLVAQASNSDHDCWFLGCPKALADHVVRLDDLLSFKQSGLITCDLPKGS